MVTVPVKIVRLWSARGELSLAEDAELVDGVLTFPEATGNDLWQVWKEYPREEDKGKWFLHYKVAESDVAAAPNRSISVAEYHDALSRDFVEAQYKSGRSTYCPTWLSQKLVDELEWPNNLDPVEAMDWPGEL